MNERHETISGSNLQQQKEERPSLELKKIQEIEEKTLLAQQINRAAENLLHSSILDSVIVENTNQERVLPINRSDTNHTPSVSRILNNGSSQDPSSYIFVNEASGHQAYHNYPNLPRPTIIQNPTAHIRQNPGQSQINNNIVRRQENLSSIINIDPEFQQPESVRYMINPIQGGNVEMVEEIIQNSAISVPKYSPPHPHDDYQRNKSFHAVMQLPFFNGSRPTQKFWFFLVIGIVFVGSVVAVTLGVTQ
ncbi:hypothetical protein G9A89_003779 [Geosiphon pyriformis]|nr:hypothetical protein G9A89_003779 [Geosiphon pyriformis]